MCVCVCVGVSVGVIVRSGVVFDVSVVVGVDVGVIVIVFLVDSDLTSGHLFSLVCVCCVCVGHLFRFAL